ncbi:hypothetical protein [Pseudoclavibacter sp. JSM 162008]|uniref:hypothetical protein n=1 Tax=Pseudoclavibacter sp. JSM 162008 TaxID=3229855 RepID=UPI003523770B
MRFVRTAAVSVAVVTLGLCGCSSPEQEAAPTETAASSPTPTPQISEADAIAECVALWRGEAEKIAPSTAADFDTKYDAETVKTSIQDGEWRIVLTPKKPDPSLKNMFCETNGNATTQVGVGYDDWV